MSAYLFDGKTYNPKRDEARLLKQVDAVFALMSDGKWRTLYAIGAELGIDSTASISARLRDCRKPRWGSHKVDRKYLHDGIWQYRLRLAHEKREIA